MMIIWEAKAKRRWKVVRHFAGHLHSSWRGVRRRPLDTLNLAIRPQGAVELHQSQPLVELCLREIEPH